MMTVPIKWFFRGKRLITVKTVSYTGWKIVSVVPMSAFNMGLYGTRQMFVIMLMALSMLMIIIINQACLQESQNHYSA